MRSAEIRFREPPHAHLGALPDCDSLPRKLAFLLPASVSLRTIYTTGQTYIPSMCEGKPNLAAHRGREAAAEFQKIIDHRSIVLNEPIGALAYLQLGRAYVVQSDDTNAKASYQHFLALWKDADPDIPIYRQAKLEYAKLRAGSPVK